MKISKKVLSKFNAGFEPCFNENYNKANGLPNMIEYSFLRQVKQHLFGILGGKLTQKHLDDFLSYNTWQPSEALKRHAQREGI